MILCFGYQDVLRGLQNFGREIKGILVFIAIMKQLIVYFIHKKLYNFNNTMLKNEVLNV